MLGKKLLIVPLVLVSGICLGTVLSGGIALAETETVSQEDTGETLQAQTRPRPRPRPTFFEEERRFGVLGDTFLVDALDGGADPFYRTGGEGMGSPDSFPKILPPSLENGRSAPRSPRGGPFGIFENLPPRSR